MLSAFIFNILTIFSLILNTANLFVNPNLPLFDDITFKRRYYFTKNTNEYFFFPNFFLNLPKRKYFDFFVGSKIYNESFPFSYSKASKIVSQRIGKRRNNLLNITHAYARNIAMGFDIYNNYLKNKRRIQKIFVMLDKKFVDSQFNNEKGHMIKTSYYLKILSLFISIKKTINRISFINSLSPLSKSSFI